jgi:xylulokinase
MRLIGVDVGTSSCKAALFDFEGNLKAIAGTEYTTDTSKPGAVELHPEKVWGALVNTFRTLLRDQNKQGEEYVIGFSVLGDALIPVGRCMEPLYPAILSSDTRSSRYVEQIERAWDRRRLYTVTGRFPHTMGVLNRILWIKETLPEVFAKASMFLDYQSWILTRLGFTPVTDYSSANGTFFFDVRKKEYVMELLAWVGVTKEQVPEVKASGSFLGELDSSGLQELGFGTKDKASVVLGALDQVCNAIGSGTMKPNDIVCGTGTVECTATVLPSTVDENLLYENNLIIGNGALPEQYVTFTFLWTGGGLLRWYRDNFGHKAVEVARNLGRSPYEILLGQEARISDVFVLPHWAGSGTPDWDSTSKGAILGLSLSSTNQSVVNGLLEGVTFDLKYNLEVLQEVGFKISALKATGGGARSDKWLQLKADVLNITIQTITCEESGCLGAAMLAGHGQGVFSLETDVHKMVTIKQEYHPDKARNYLYTEKYDLLYHRLYPRLREINSLIDDFNSQTKRD